MKHKRIWAGILSVAVMASMIPAYAESEPDDGYSQSSAGLSEEEWASSLNSTEDSDEIEYTELYAEGQSLTSNAVSQNAANISLIFSDVSENAWYAPAVAYAYENNIVSGTGDGKFSPDMNLTRGMLVMMLYNYSGKPETTGSSKFSDINEDDWYAQAVMWAENNGIVAGYSDGLFHPNDAIIRQDVMLILQKFTTYRGISAEGWRDLSGFNDNAKISSYARSAVRWAYSYGIVSGTSSTTMSPRGTATRAECAQMIYNYSGKNLSVRPTAVSNLCSANHIIQYTEMCEYLDAFSLIYPDLIRVYTAGTSEEGRSIKQVVFGHGKRYIYMQGNLHAREYLSENYLLEMLDTYAYYYTTNQTYCGYSVKNLLDTFTIVIVPCANPDGQNIALNGYNAAANPSAVKKLYNPTGSASQWKANVKGVDLNRNFPVYWSGGNTSKAGYAGYGGSSAACAKETKVIINILKSYKFETVIDCHTAGNLIYYTDSKCSSTYNKTASAMAKAMSKVSGYTMKNYSDPGEGCANYGRHIMGLPSFTVELYPTSSYPLKYANFYSVIWDKAKSIPLAAMNYLA